MKNCRLNDSLCRISVSSIIKAAVAAPKIKIVTCRIRSPSLMRPSLAAILFGSTCTHACTHTEKLKKREGEKNENQWWQAGFVCPQPQIWTLLNSLSWLQPYILHKCWFSGGVFWVFFGLILDFITKWYDFNWTNPLPSKFKCIPKELHQNCNPKTVTARCIVVVPEIKRDGDTWENANFLLFLFCFVFRLKNNKTDHTLDQPIHSQILFLMCKIKIFTLKKIK